MVAILEEAVNFPHNGLYIEYKIDLPSNVKFTENSKNCSFGRTQICFTKEENTVNLKIKKEKFNKNHFRKMLQNFRFLSK